MTAQTVMLMVVIAGFAACGITSMVICNAIVEAINQKRDSRNQLEIFWWHMGVYLRVFREYKALYPQGRLIRSYLVAVSIALVLVLIAALVFLFGFSGPSQAG
jgi:uncharacterized protein YggT (Ycf19 family)